MVRSPCCDSNNLKKGPWTPEEDGKLVDYINSHGHTNWKTLPKHAGLNRCGKSCRLRWINYLRPDIKRGKFSEEEELLIINLHSVLGNKWSMIATHLPGRTDNEIKNFWNTHIRKKLLQMGIDPLTHKPRTDHLVNLSQLLGAAQFGSFQWDHSVLKLQADAAELAKIHLIERILRILNTGTLSGIDHFTGLLDSQHINPIERLHINGADALCYTKQQTPASQGLFNPITPQATTDLHASSTPWACYEGGFGQGALDIKNNVSLSSSWDVQTESRPLPELLSASVTPDKASIVNKMEDDKTNPSSHFTDSSPTSPFFDAWEKLVDDETCSSYWKDILEN